VAGCVYLRRCRFRSAALQRTEDSFCAATVATAGRG